MAFLREKILSAIKPDGHIGRAIYLSRKNSTWGKPTNEAEFEQMLKAKSIQPVCLEDMNFKQQVETIHSADVIIAPTGSALNMAIPTNVIRSNIVDPPKNLPVVATTADPQWHNPKRCIEFAFNSGPAQPVNLSQLDQNLRKFTA